MNVSTAFPDDACWAESTFPSSSFLLLNSFVAYVTAELGKNSFIMNCRKIHDRVRIIRKISI